MKYSTVTIVFPTHNGWEDTQNCLASIKNLNYPQEKIKVIVVDNASSDGTTNKLRKAFPGVKLIINPTNLGFAKAVNSGAKKAASELLLITNNDVVFNKDCLKKLVASLADHPNAGVAGGKVLDRRHRDQVFLGGFRLNPYLAYHQFDLSRLDQERETDWVSGNCLLTKRKLFFDLGGFDEEYFFYFEDVDFCLRAKKAGFKLVYTPQAILFHGHGKTILKEKAEKIFYLGYQSRWRCVFKNATLVQAITSSLLLLTLFPLHQSWLARRNVFRPMLKGLFSNLKKFPKRGKTGSISRQRQKALKPDQ